MAEWLEEHRDPLSDKYASSEPFSISDIIEISVTGLWDDGLKSNFKTLQINTNTVLQLKCSVSEMSANGENTHASFLQPKVTSENQ